jgi:hypothetical protein
MMRRSVGAGALVLAVSLTGCAAETAAPPAAESTGRLADGAAAAPVGKVVMIIRHGEKPGRKGGAPGVDETGRADEHSMTRTGWQRAYKLADVFDGVGPTPPGLTRPAVIYAAHANENGRGDRTRETVRPLAEKIGVPVNTAFGKGDEQALARSVESEPGPTLISWQHSEIPDIAESFGTVTPAPPTEWPDNRYDVVWTLTKTPTGWRFGQIPQMLLPGDRAVAITD